MVTFSSLRWPEDREFLSQMFAILHANMSRIVPTGDSYEQGYAMWSQAKEVEYANSPSRSVVLIRLDGNIAGYFQYSILGDTFKMEDIQFDPGYRDDITCFACYMSIYCKFRKSQLPAVHGPTSANRI